MKEQSIAVGWAEQMKGYVTFGGALPADQTPTSSNSGQRCAFALSANVGDIDTYVHQPAGVASAQGHVDCPPLGGRCVIESGEVNLLVDVIPHRHNIKDMRYRLFFRSPEGSKYTLAGIKYVDNDGVLRLWYDTTTLFTKVYEGYVTPVDECGASPIARGILYLGVIDFIRMILSFHSNGPTLRARFRSLAKFLAFFSSRLWQVYGPGRKTNRN